MVSSDGVVGVFKTSACISLHEQRFVHDIIMLMEAR
jgi:hypothetical protein